MTRDEILDAIKRAATLDPTGTGPDEIQSSMRSVARLADQYPDHADADSLAEALADAIENFADMLQPYA